MIQVVRRSIMVVPSEEARVVALRGKGVRGPTLSQPRGQEYTGLMVLQLAGPCCLLTLKRVALPKAMGGKRTRSACRPHRARTRCSSGPLGLRSGG